MPETEEKNQNDDESTPKRSSLWNRLWGVKENLVVVDEAMGQV